MKSLDCFTYNGTIYYRGSVIVREAKEPDQEEKEIFVRYLPEKHMYVVRPLPPSKTYGAFPRKVYYESIFVKTIIRIELPTQDSVYKAWEVENDLLEKNRTKDISNSTETTPM